MDELMASHDVISAKELADSETLAVLITPDRDGLRRQLFQWASAKFPDIHVIHALTVTPPAICADGETREIGKYIEYCLGKHMGEVIEGLKAVMPGIQPSWSMLGNTLRIHVTRIT